MKVTGQILKDHREKKDLSMEKVCLATKINVKFIEAIEKGDTDLFYTRAYLTGFVRTYAIYLKLDVDSVLDTYHNEMKEMDVGENKSDLASVEQEYVGDEKKISFKLLSYVLGFVVLSGLIFFVSNQYEKYQKEQMQTEDASHLAGGLSKEKGEGQSGLLKDEPSTSEGMQKKEKIPLKSKSVAKTLKDRSEKSAESTKVASIKKTEKVTEKQTKEEPPVKPEQVLAAVGGAESLDLEANSEKLAAVEKQEKVIAETGEEKTKKTSLKPAVVRLQEVILESLDKTMAEVSVDGGDFKNIRLLSDSLHTIKAKKSIKLKIENGGVVSIIHNGRDKGVLGELGKPLSVKFP